MVKAACIFSEETCGVSVQSEGTFYEKEEARYQILRSDLHAS